MHVCSTDYLDTPELMKIEIDTYVAYSIIEYNNFQMEQSGSNLISFPFCKICKN